MWELDFKTHVLQLNAIVFYYHFEMSNYFIELESRMEFYSKIYLNDVLSPFQFACLNYNDNHMSIIPIGMLNPHHVQWMTFDKFLFVVIIFGFELLFSNYITTSDCQFSPNITVTIH